MAVSDDELSYLVADPEPSGEPAQNKLPEQVAGFIIRRIHLH
jgi:hypothetical protein